MNIQLLETGGTRSESAYFDACNAVWDALTFYKMQCPAAWRLLRIVHRTGTDFALNAEEVCYVNRQLQLILGA